MKRIALTDETGGWFDLEKSTKFKEGTNWDGRNHISKSTGSQFEHQWLYRTKNGKWIINEWSQWQGTTESFIEVADEYAANWFIKNEYQPEEIPEALQFLLEKYISEKEV
jgi:hypothetical protein